MNLKFSHFCQVFQQLHLHSHTCHAMLIGCESTGATYHHTQLSRVAFGSRAVLHRRDMNLLLAATVDAEFAVVDVKVNCCDSIAV
jgi:hypothetical protein